MFIVEHQPHGSLAHFRGKLVRRLAHDGSTFSGVGASGKSGAVHTISCPSIIARLTELRAAGVTAATMSRMERDGEVLRLARGLYQLPDAPLDAHHSLAEAAKRVPKGVVCLVSALAFHQLTDQLPRQVWIAIGQKDWAPKGHGVPVRLVRFTDRLLTEAVEFHAIEGVPVKVFGVAKTVADCFRYRNKIGLSVAIEGLQEALRQRKTTPSEMVRQAERGAIATVIRPYLEALTANG